VDHVSIHAITLHHRYALYAHCGTLATVQARVI